MQAAFTGSPPVPIAAKFSSALYDRLGHPVADELVDWFNSMDSEYRTELRELNERNFARFDDRLDTKFAAFDAKFAAFDAKFAEFTLSIERRLAQFTSDLKDQQITHMRWMIGMWLAVFLAVMGLWIRR